MSTSSSLSSAKRRRASGNDQSNSINTLSSVQIDSSDESKHIMSVQDVLYMLNGKIENLSRQVLEPKNKESGSSDSSNDMITQITDSIDNMNNTLEQFSELLTDYDSRIQAVETNSNATALEDKVKQLETRINEKILSKGSEKIDFLSKKRGTTTKEMLAEKVPTKKGTTVGDKFAESENKKESLKKFEQQSSLQDDENMKISFTGLKDKIETNKDN